MTRLLYCYNPAPEYDERRRESERWIQEINKYIQVVKQPCTGIRDYPNCVKEVWGESNLIILEQDIVPPMRPIQALQDMLLFIGEYDLVSWRYKLYPISTALVNPVYAHRIWEEHDRAGRRLRWIETTDFKADYVGLGFAGISLRVQRMIPRELFDSVPTWKDVDSCLSEWTQQKLHMQWYVPAMECKHNHK